jgi:hypothetical protein
MKRRLLHIIAAAIFAASALVPLAGPAPKAGALANSDFNAARIMDDSVFFNPNTMSSVDIQNFLNSKVPVCDTNHAPGGGYNPPFICLKDYVQTTTAQAGDQYCASVPGGTKSAATIIKEVASACNINPQVIIVLLQKEQSFITDTWPWPLQYERATGFGCPDHNNGQCYPEYAGFFKQVYYGARQFQIYAKRPELFNFRAGQTANILYNPDAGCGSSAVTIQNQATAGLYNYTPYQPNSNVLNAAHGQVVPCGAYGNINFWWQFWSWFGNPIGSSYAWLINHFSFSGGDNVLTKGVVETVTLKAKNVGRLPWYSGGNNPVRLGTWQPADHASPLLNGGIRYAGLTESVVQPNEVGTFTFTLTPQTSGTFIEAMNLVVENSTWMAWPGFSPTITVAPTPYQYQVQNILYSNGSGVTEPGVPQDMTIVVKNTGNVTWSKSSGPPIWLGTWTPGRSSEVRYAESGKWPSNIRITEMNENTVAPGQTAGFQFKVNTPRAGLFYEKISLVAEGEAWMFGEVPTLWLSGGSFAWEPLWVSHSTGNANIPRGQSFRLTVKAKNTGSLAWRQNMKLATVAPMDRSSPFHSDFWLALNRTSALVETSVPPGGLGTFTFIANSPAIPGAYNERFSLVAENQAWLNDPGLSIYVKSL